MQHISTRTKKNTKTLIKAFPDSQYASRSYIIPLDLMSNKMLYFRKFLIFHKKKIPKFHFIKLNLNVGHVLEIHWVRLWFYIYPAQE